MNDGIIGSMKELGVTESYKLKRQVILSASEAAEMILRYVFFLFSTTPHAYVNYWISPRFSVDDILRATPRKREAV